MSRPTNTSAGIHTLGGILDRLKQVRKDTANCQCPASHTKVTKRGEANTVFCTHREGHEGVHKGFRRTWTDETNGETVAK